MEYFKFKIGDRVEILPEHDYSSITKGCTFAGLKGTVDENYSTYPWVKLDEPPTNENGYTWITRAVEQDNLKSI